MRQAGGIPLRYIVEEIDERSGRDLPLLSVSIHLGVRRRDELTDDEPRADTLESYKRCRRGDVVVNRMRAFQGALGVAPVDGVVSPDYAVLRPSAAADARFVAYVLRSPWGVAEMASRLRGIGGVASGVVRTPRVNVADLFDIRIPASMVDHQSTIADFLDRECQRIAAVSAAAARAASVLAEQQRETFERLVVGVETAPLRYLVHGIDQGWSPECDAQRAAPGEWGVLKVGCVNYGAFRPEEHKRLPADLDPRPEYEVRVGDLLVSRANTKELVGSAAVVDDLAGWRLMLCDKTYRLRLLPGVTAGFVCEALASRACRDQIEMATAGASSSMQNISQGTVRELRVPYVDVPGQVAIEQEVAKRRSRLLAARAALAELGVRLHEYRDALVTEAVTGQIDVSAFSDAQMDERAHAAVEGAVAIALAPAQVG